MKAGINELKTLTKYISCECKCKFDRGKCNSDQWWNNNKRHFCEKDYISNPATCDFKNWKYLESIMDDSVIVCDEIIESPNTQTNKQKLLQPVVLYCTCKL